MYIENSLIFSLDQVTTPLLRVQGQQDGGTPFVQALKMFLGMKRAKKKLWLLQYEKANHVLLGKDAVDYTLRLKQFFDYYLKGTPQLLWMIEGVIAKDKDIDSGLDYDSSGSQS